MTPSKFPRPVLTSALPEEGQPVFTLKRSLFELTRHLVSNPSDEAALSAVCVALRAGGQVEDVIALLELHSNAGQGDGLLDRAMAELSFRIAAGSTAADARELCHTALDLYPVHVAALSLFEELTDPSWTDELCARYEMFLEAAPSQGVAADICEAVTNKLVEAEREAALEHEDLGDVHCIAHVPEGLCNLGMEPELLVPLVLAEPCEVRWSGAWPVASDADVLGADEDTLRIGCPISRSNAPGPIVPSIVVDTSYLHAVSSVADRMRARRRSLALAVVGGVLCGALAFPLTAQLASPMAAPTPATSVVKNVGGLCLGQSDNQSHE